MVRLSFEHDSISDLSKSIRKQLKSTHNIDIKHTEMLGILSHSVGFQNFQSYKANAEKDTSVGQHLIQLSFMPNDINGTFERDQSGVIQDRRYEKAPKVLASIPIKIKTAQQEAFFKVQVWIDYENLPERYSKQPEYFLANAAIDFFQSEKGKQLLSHLDMCHFEKVSLNGNLNKQFEVNSETKFNVVTFTLSVEKPVLVHLNMQIAKVLSASEAFEYAINKLKELAYDAEIGDISKELRQRIFSWVNFIEHAIEIVSESRGLNLYGWNHEKFPTIKKVMTQIANNQEPDEDDLEYTKRNLYVMSASDIWLDEPPAIDKLYV